MVSLIQKHIVQLLLELHCSHTDSITAGWGGEIFYFLQHSEWPCFISVLLLRDCSDVLLILFSNNSTIYLKSLSGREQNEA